MKFSFSEEQDEFRTALRRFLQAKSPTTEVRKQMQTDQGYDPGLWQQMCEELALASLHIPEECGGAGFGIADLAIACEEMGRALLCSPYFGSVVLAATAIREAGSDDQKRHFLPGFASGETIGALCAVEGRGGWAADSISMSAEKSGDAYQLTGTKSHVVDGMIASLLVVVARKPDGALGMFIVDASDNTVSRKPQNSMDPTRKLSTVSFAKTPAVLLTADNSNEAYERTLDIALACLASEMVGGAERLREDALEYVSMRMQFGRSIASFQVTKHKAADMLLDVELAKSAAYYAAAAIDDGDTDARGVVALAKAGASDAYIQTAVHAVQMHGGIGFTYDNDTHLWFKRAKASEVFLGDANQNRERMLQNWGDNS
jgi:alkylation response protein AidB-like acyl-CoA dehydrogenase